jgi:serine protease Do
MRNHGVILKAVAFGILALNLLLASPSSLAQQKGSSKLYPLPIVEAGRVLSRWLTESGFEVSRSSSEAGTVRLIGLKDDELWVIVLQTHSPLASSIQAQYALKGRSDPVKLEILWTFLENYSKGAYREERNADQGSPAWVVMKKEFVACIMAKRGNEPIQFSGFIIDPRGVILSTAHDLKGIDEIKVILNSGREYNGRPLKIDPFRDLTLIGIDLRFPSFISPEKGRSLLEVGERVYSIGCPQERRGIIHSGTVSRHLKQNDDLPLWQVEMETLPGSSGSPVFDLEGNLVGVIKGRYRGTDSVGFLIPLETVIDFLQEK